MTQSFRDRQREFRQQEVVRTATRWIGTDASPYEQVVSYLAALMEDAAQAGSLEDGVDPELVTQAILALASTPAWRRLALRGSPERLLREMAVLVSIFGAEATDA